MELLLHWERNIYTRSQFFFVGHAFLLSAFSGSYTDARTRLALLLSLAGFGLSVIFLYVGLREWHAYSLASDRILGLESDDPKLGVLREVRMARDSLPLLSESVFVIVAVGLPIFLLLLWSSLAYGAVLKLYGRCISDWLSGHLLSIFIGLAGVILAVWPWAVKLMLCLFRMTWEAKAGPVARWMRRIAPYSRWIWSALAVGLLLMLAAFSYLVEAKAFAGPDLWGKECPRLASAWESLHSRSLLMGPGP